MKYPIHHDPERYALAALLERLQRALDHGIHTDHEE